MSLLQKIQRNKVAKETTWAFLTKGITLVLLYALDVFLARYLGPNQYGQWAFFFSILTILILVSNLGINSSAQKFVAQYNTTPALRAVLKSSVRLRIAATLIFTIGLLLFHRPLAEAMGRPDIVPLLAASVPLVFFMGLVEYVRHIFIGLHRNKYTFILNLLDYGLRLALVAFFLVSSTGLIAVLYSFLLSSGVAAAAGLAILYYVFYRTLPASSESYTREIFRYSIPMIVLSIGFIVLTELDNVMIGLLLNSNEQVAHYAVAQRIIVKLPQINLAIAMGVLPLFARMTEENRGYLGKMLRKMLIANTLIFGAVCTGILATSWWFVPLIYGEAYQASVLPLNILTLYLLLCSYSIYLSGVLDYQGLANRRAVYLTISIILKVVLNLVLIPRWGIAGAAVASSTCYVPYLVLNWMQVRKQFLAPAPVQVLAGEPDNSSSSL